MKQTFNGLWGLLLAVIFMLLLGPVAARAQSGPTITQDLTNLSVLAGSNATLSVAVSGPGPFTYQWQFNGTNLSSTAIITTVAGNGSNTYSGDGGAATNASLNYPSGVAVDAYGNIFIADTDNNRIREIGTNGIIKTVAGNGVVLIGEGNGSYSGDGGAATNAGLSGPSGVAMDAYGNIFIADTDNNRIRKVGTNGIITTVAGNGVVNGGIGEGSGSYSGDGGPATNAGLSGPSGVAVDAYGNIFIADTDNNRIREVGTNGIINTVAGGGDGGDGGAATNADLNYPDGVAVDIYGNIFIADTDNNRIREVGTNGIINTVAGGGVVVPGGGTGDGGTATNADLNHPSGVVVDSFGNMLIADTENSRIWKVGTNGIINTVAGNGVFGGIGSGWGSYSGDGGAATNAGLSGPSGVAVDAYGNILIADTDNSRIRKVVFQGPKIVLTNVATSNAGSYDVVVTSPYGSVTSSVVTLSVVFPPTLTSQPQNQTVTVGSNATFGVTVSGTPPFYYQWTFDGGALPSQTNNALELIAPSPAIAGSYQVMVSNIGGSVTSSVANLSVVYPVNIIAQPENQTVLVGNNTTLSVTVSGTGPFTYQWQRNGTNLPSSIITTVAGNGVGYLGSYSGDGGAATNAGLALPSGVALDTSGNLYIADMINNRIRKVGTNGIIATVAGGGETYPGNGGAATNTSLEWPQGVALDGEDNLLIADTGHNCVREVTFDIIITVAGGNYGYSGDGGPAISAELANPEGMAVDAYGNLFIADNYNNRIREVGNNGIITTVAGNGSYGFSGDGGAATNARLSNPTGVAVDAYGNLFIADTYNGRIRKVGTNGVITTVAGNGTYGNFGDSGTATNAALNYPSGVAVDAYGNLFISTANYVQEVGTNGIITTVAGNGTRSYSGDGGAATNASLDGTNGVAIDTSGNLFIADSGNNRIRKVTFQGPNLVLTNLAFGNAGSYDVVVTSPYDSVTSSVVSLTVLVPPQNLSASLIPGQGVQFQFTGTPTNGYVLLATTNLTPPIDWQPVVTNLTDINGNWTFTDTSALTNPARFYRAMLP